MTQLADPGKELPPEAARQARQVAWAPPKTKAARTKARNDRLDDWLATVPEPHRERARKAAGR